MDQFYKSIQTLRLHYLEALALNVDLLDRPQTHTVTMILRAQLAVLDQVLELHASPSFPPTPLSGTQDTD